MNRLAAILFALVFAFVALAHEPAEMTTVILVRHAEKDRTVAQNDDTPLTKPGEDRAAELARVLGNTNITAIYTTKTKRTRDTAAPLAAKKKIERTEIEKGRSQQDLAQELIARGGTIVVVGHSNTTPELMTALGVANAPTINDGTEFDSLFIVTLCGSADPKLVHLKYGAASPTPSAPPSPH
jgi:2,3-bisphosphoglycerate-dependent phosphoglycerate mutase